jgi:hypothetical protein
LIISLELTFYTLRRTYRETEGRGNKRRYIYGGRKICPALKVPTLCPIFLLVEVSLREGKALGSEKCKVLGLGLYEQRK